MFAVLAFAVFAQPPVGLMAGQMATPAPAVSMMPYDETVRCAGLAQAASEMEGGETVTGKSLSDAALYWSLTATQVATASGKPGETADADQNRARIAAVQQLNAQNTDTRAYARADLQRCRQRTPDLG